MDLSKHVLLLPIVLVSHSECSSKLDLERNQIIEYIKNHNTSRKIQIFFYKVIATSLFKLTKWISVKHSANLLFVVKICITYCKISNFCQIFIMQKLQQERFCKKEKLHFKYFYAFLFLLQEL